MVSQTLPTCPFSFGQSTAVKHRYYTSNNHRLESAGLNALEELLRCWECTEKIVKPACVF